MSQSESILTPEVAAVLKKIAPFAKENGFVLVGGTALALNLNHRRSIDLDFFGKTEFDAEALLEEIKNLFDDSTSFEVVGKDRNTLNLLINQVKVDILRHNYPSVDAPVENEGIPISSIGDIAAMKLSAINNRGARKDFYDLYFLLRHHSLEELLEFYRLKYPDHDPFFILRSLTYFDDAESEPDPELLEKISWNDVKETICVATRDLATK